MKSQLEACGEDIKAGDSALAGKQRELEGMGHNVSLLSRRCLLAQQHKVDVNMRKSASHMSLSCHGIFVPGHTSAVAGTAEMRQQFTAQLEDVKECEVSLKQKVTTAEAARDEAKAETAAARSEAEKLTQETEEKVAALEAMKQQLLEQQTHLEQEQQKLQVDTQHHTAPAVTPEVYRYHFVCRMWL